MTLLQRTTRKLSLTAQGRAYYDQCSEPLGQLVEAERALTPDTEDARGPAEDFRSRHPWSGAVLRVPIRVHEKISCASSVDLFITNLFVDLVTDNIDVAIRFGELADSTHHRQADREKRPLSRRFAGLSARPNCAGKARRPSQASMRLLNGRNNEVEWHLVSGRKSVKLHVSGPVSSRDFQSVSAFTYRGHGIGLLPSNYCEPEIKRGDLVRILPEWSSPAIFIHAVYPTRRFVPSKLQVFLDELKAWKSPLWLPLG